LRYYPINLNLRGRRVIVVGGGAVAARKAKRLVSAGGDVVVVAPAVTKSLASLRDDGKLTHIARGYREGDLAGALLVFAATDDRAVNQAVAAEARERAILVDLVDAPARGDFTTPAVLEQGELVIAVSTGGASPALSRRIVDQLQPLFGPEYAEAVALLSAVREKILTVKAGSAYNERVFAELAALDLPALIKNGQRDEIDQIVLKLAASGSRPVPDGTDEKDPP
jgi:precorrin-2 dehydrogenase / sirohydrochlorin ferrochelatase